MTNQDLLLLIIAFIVKHFVVDFLLQTKWQYSNKHKLGHPGGIFHAGLHSIATMFLLSYFGIDGRLIGSLGISEGIIHYFIDYFKMNIGIHYGWKCNENEEFWWLLGLDQFLHYLTYCGILFILLTFV